MSLSKKLFKQVSPIIFCLGFILFSGAIYATMSKSQSLAITDHEESVYAQDILVEKSGSFIINDTDNTAIKRVDFDGNVINRFSTTKLVMGLDALNDYVYFSKRTSTYLYRLNFDFTETAPVYDAGEAIYAVAIDSLENSYIIQSGKIAKYTADFNRDASFGIDGEVSVAYVSGLTTESIVDLALDETNGYLYITVGNQNIYRMKTDGTNLETFKEVDGGELNRIEVDSKGNVYVLISNQNKIQKFDSVGIFIEEFIGDYGDETGLDGSYGLGLDSKNYVWVGQTDMSRLIKIDHNATIPSPPMSFAISTSDTQITYDWAPGPDTDYEAVTLKWSSSTYPATVTDGSTVFESRAGVSYTEDLAFSNGTYYFSLFAKDADGNYSNPITANITIAMDSTPPAPVSELSATIFRRAATLAWTNPSDSDFASVTIRRSTSGVVADISEGTLVTENATSTVLYETGLADGTYFYSIFSKDSFGNVSTPVTKSCTILVTAPASPDMTATKVSPNATDVTLAWTVPMFTQTFKLTRSMDGGSEEIINASLASSVTGSIQSDLEDGEYLYRIYAIDDEDHESVAGSVAVVIDSTPPESPIVLVEKHGPTSNVVTVSWASTEIGVTYTLIRIQNAVQTVISTNIKEVSYDDVAPEGTQKFGVYVSDAYSNRSSLSQTNTIRIDTVAPTPPSNLSSTRQDQRVTLSWIRSLDTAGIMIRKRRDRFPQSIDDGTLITQNALINSIEIEDLEEGTHYFSIFAKDEFGNRSISTKSVTVDLSSSSTHLVDRGELWRGSVIVTTNVIAPVINQEIGKDSSGATLSIQAIYTSTGSKIGTGAGSLGTIVMDSSNGRWTEQSTVILGDSGGIGQIIQSDGIIDISGVILIGVGSGNTGHYALSGGTLNADSIQIGQEGGVGSFNWTGGTLQTTGVIGNLVNSGGTLLIPQSGVVVISGDYTQTASGKLQVTISSSDLLNANEPLSSNPAKLAIEGEANLSGTLQVVLEGEIQRGKKIYVLDAPNVSMLRLTETNLTLDLPGLDAGLKWDTSLFESSGVIQVVGDSGTLLESRPLNYPNPFKMTSGTEIGYFLNESADIELRVYTAVGSEIYRKKMSAGEEGGQIGYNKVSINRTLVGEEWPTGVYPYVLIHSGKVVGQGKMVVRP